MPNPPPVCSTDFECGESDACVQRRCVEGSCATQTAQCDDGDVCTDNACDPQLGCVFPELTFDSDGDGFKGPRPGFAPGAPDSCGTDCDDRSAAAFPGGKELCDGVDNDCNGIVDDNTTYVASKLSPLRISTAEGTRGQRGSMVGTPDGFVLTYSMTALNSQGGEQSRGLIKGLSRDRTTRFEHLVSDVNAETYSGSLAWSGQLLASASSDARQERNYEIYLNRFSAAGDKLSADQRVTNAPGFSKRASLLWNRSEFVLAWDDRRSEGQVAGDRVGIFGQRVAPDGTLLGENLPLVDDGLVNESAELALSPQRIGMVYTVSPPSGASGASLGFRVFDANLAEVGANPGTIGVDVQSPLVQFVGDRFIALWYVYPNNGSPGDAIWAAAFDVNGKLLLAPQPVTSGAKFARFPDALSLGDRLLLVWSDDHDGNFEVYWEVLGPDLSVRESRQRLTFTPTDSQYPTLAAGPDGTIGVMFEDFPEGSRQVYLTSLECGAPMP